MQAGQREPLKDRKTAYKLEFSSSNLMADPSAVHASADQSLTEYEFEDEPKDLTDDEVKLLTKR